MRWRLRAEVGRLDDDRPSPVEAPHALLDWERAAIVELAETWGETDLSHRKLAHRGSRLEKVYVSESTVLRVLIDYGVHLPERGQASRVRRGRGPSGPSSCPG